MLIFLPSDCSQYYSLNFNFGNFDFTTLRNNMSKRLVKAEIPEFSIDFEIQNMEPELSAVCNKKLRKKYL